MSIAAHSHIIYAIEAWGLAFKTELEKMVLVLQKKGYETLTFKDAYPTVHGPLISSDPISRWDTLKISDVIPSIQIHF